MGVTIKILHHIRRENSGLMRSALEIAHCEEKLGHIVTIREPSTNNLLYGADCTPDIHCVHSQLHPSAYQDGIPKTLFCHGEPLSSVANKVSMKAILDLAPAMDAFICMREGELSFWKSIKRATYLVPKGVDLEVYRPMAIDEANGVKKLAGSPAVLYCENWRGERNPLVLCVAMQKVLRELPDARLHIFNCCDQKMLDTFRALLHGCHWWTFVKAIAGPAEDVVKLYNGADIVVSCLFPLFARTAVESLACGKAHVAPGYRVDSYPYTCELDPDSMADGIISAWKNEQKIDFRKWAEGHHDAMESTRQVVKIFERLIAK